MYDLIIIGGGPAGISAGIYAGRKAIKTILITDIFGGQSIVSDNIENWIGEKCISGFDLAKKMENHLRAQENIEIVEGDKVSEIKKSATGFLVKTLKGKNFETKTLLITSGSSYKRIGVSGEEKLAGKGVFYCATCDAPIMKGKDVVVVGGGNSALEAVLDLLEYARKIYLMHRRDTLKADPILQERLKNSSNVEIIFNAEIKEIIGKDKVEGVRYYNNISQKETELQVQGVFVMIGFQPNGALVKDLAQINEKGEIVIDKSTQKTSIEGIWAAGDVTDVLYRQNNISAGDAIKAVLNINDYLKK